jgi:hypothetical protein
MNMGIPSDRKMMEKIKRVIMVLESVGTGCHG